MLNFWRRTRGVLQTRGTRAQAPRLVSVEDWEARLVELGITSEVAEALAPRLVPLSRELGGRSAEALLRGAVMAVEVQAEAHARVERNLRDVREVERLLGAFSGELEKLDEVLEVLGAYAQRMRSNHVTSPPRTLQ
jgi:hypothetical protein